MKSVFSLSLSLVLSPLQYKRSEREKAEGYVTPPTSAFAISPEFIITPLPIPLSLFPLVCGDENRQLMTEENSITCSHVPAQRSVQTPTL